MFPKQQERLFQKPKLSMWIYSGISIFHLILFLETINLPIVLGCWGISVPGYGDTTKDYSLLVGDDLVVNCTLSKLSIEFENRQYDVNSSNLVFKKYPASLQVVNILNHWTAQLTIPNASETDEGMYHCCIDIPTNKCLYVCSTIVSVGYPPKPVRNFQCVSMHFESLRCSWDFEDSAIQTNYSLFRYIGFNSNDSPVKEKCPVSSSDSTHCEWRYDTKPSYDPYAPAMGSKIYFTVIAKNELGERQFDFSMNHYEIVIPNHPMKLKVTQAKQQSISLQWSPPEKIKDKIPLQYQLLIEDKNEPAKAVNLGVNAGEYTISGLIPNTAYKISVRCRSSYTSRDDMWGPYASIEEWTLPDVPYLIPNTIPEAFYLRDLEDHREVTLYWKPVPEMHHNGEGFGYCIQYFSEDDNSNVKSNCRFTTSSEITISHLQENVSYTFHLHTTNDHGLSRNNSVITIDKKINILPAPKDVSVISKEPSLYEISWKPSSHIAEEKTDYVVFYCSSLKSITWRCDGEIQWLTTSSVSTTLRLQDQDTNFQFAVATKSFKGSSGMKWVPCIITNKIVPGDMIPPRTEAINSTFVKVTWNEPLVPNGPISYYEIQWETKQRENSTDKKGARQKVVYKASTSEIELDCENVEAEGITFLFSVRAVNKVNGVALEGPLSDPTEARGCYMPQGVAIGLGIAVEGNLVLALTALLMFKLIECET